MMTTSQYWKSKQNDLTRDFLGMIVPEEAFAVERKMHWKLSSEAWKNIASIVGTDALGRHTLLLTAMAVVVNKLSGSDEKVVIWTGCLSSRTHNENNQKRIPVVIDMSAAGTIRDLIIVVRDLLEKAYENQNTSLFDSAEIEKNIQLCCIDREIHCDTTPCGIFIEQDANNMQVFVSGNIPLNKVGYFNELGKYVSVVLEHFAQINESLAAIELFDAQDYREKLNAISNPFNLSKETDVLKMIEQVCLLQPDSIAVSDDENQLTYAQLNDEVARLAEYIRVTFNIRKGDRVAVMTGRSHYTVIGLLALLKIGAVYVYISDELPQERMEYILQNSQVKLILSHSDFAEIISSLPKYASCFINFTPVAVNQSNTEDFNSIQPEDTAYVVYTSGTTGTPKGIEIIHEGLTNLIAEHLELLKINSGDVYLQFMSHSFDGSILDFLMILAGGGHLYIPSTNTIKDKQLMEQNIAKYKVSMTTMTPSYFELLENECLKTLRLCIFAGEQIKYEKAIALSKDIAVYNAYGPSEVTVNVTMYKISKDVYPNNNIPIGKVGANKRIYMLNDQLNVLPAFTIGEIAIAGTGVAKGYLNKEEKTNAAFVADLLDQSGLMYLTGDLGYTDHQGLVYYIGRKDNQVKINGYRVDTDEINYWIQAYPDLEDSVIVWDKEHKQLLGFYKGKFTDEGLLSDYLKKHLPYYMIPGKIIHVEQIPLNLNQKVDTQQLLQLAARENQNGQKHAERSASEELVYDLWLKILKVEELDTSKDLFSLGFDSIKLIQFVYELKKKEISVTTKDVLELKTLKRIAEKISFETNAKKTEGIPGNSEIDSTAYGLTDMQQLMIRESFKEENRAFGVYHCVVGWRIGEQKADQEAIVRAIQVIIDENDALRTRFILNEKQEIIQKVEKTGSYTIEKQIISDLASADQELEHIYQSEISQTFHFEQTTPWNRFKVIRIHEHEFMIYMSIHHALIDGWSGVEIRNRFLEVYSYFKQSQEVSIQSKGNNVRELVEIQNGFLQKNKPEYVKKFFEQFHFENEKLPEIQHETGFRTKELFLDEKTFEKINERIVELNITKKAFFFAVVANAYLNTLQRKQESFGIVVNGRTEQLSSPLDSVGLFWNILPFPYEMTGDLETESQDIQGKFLEWDALVNAPVNRLAEAFGKNIEVNCCFNFIELHNAEDDTDLQDEFKLIDFKSIDRFHYPITIVIFRSHESYFASFGMRIEYNSRYFTEEIIEALQAEIVASMNHSILINNSEYGTNQ